MSSTDTALTQEEEDFLAKGDVKDHFAEYNEVIKIIDDLHHAYANQTKSELSDEGFNFILNKYQEQPHLLDPHLEELLTKLLKLVRTTETGKLLHHAFKYLYLITKVRGHKAIVRLFPHEVSDLEPIMTMLSKQNPYDRETWENKYMLLLWLSMICLIPFDMDKFDSEGSKPLIERIIDVAKLYLMLYGDKCQEAAALVLSKILTRPDAQEQHLPNFITWCVEKICDFKKEDSAGIATLQGPLLALATIFAVGKRSSIIPFAPIVLQAIQKEDLPHNQHSQIRKLSVKLVQRLGITFLKPILPKWRYQRGCRSLKDTLKSQNQDAADKTNIDGEEDEYDVPDEIESVIECLMNALYDSDTIVRWSAAKGIGRVTSRLPRDLADEVVGSVLDCFSDTQADGAYHGGCLTLAELGRRGLLLPHRLEEVVPILLHALVFDLKRGAFSVGANVRDSACYLAWSFARAYNAETIAPYVEKIARSLLIVTAYDREVNCRRAASAAFQENVGRQGQFPHGIDILTKADYFAVGSRTDSYLVIGPYIASFKEYTVTFIDHLCERKVDHWDPEIRLLTAIALHNLVPISPTYMADAVLAKLLPMCTGIDLVARHGSIIAVAEIIHSLSGVETSTGSVGLISRNKHLKTAFGICKELQNASVFRGFGNELMRLAICHLITRVSECRALIKPPPAATKSWLKVIHDTLSNLDWYVDVEKVCNAAVKALAEVNHITIPTGDFTEVALNQKSDGKANDVLDSYILKLKSSSEKERIGYSQAISALPKHVVNGRYMKILNALMAATKKSGSADAAFAEAHMHAVQALVKICKGMDIKKDGNPDEALCVTNVNDVYETLIHCLSDYTKDNRGDIGSIVRLAGIRGLEMITLEIVQKDKSILNKEIIRKLMCSVLQQSGEKIHKVRDGARDALFSLLHNNPKVPFIPHHDELVPIFINRGYMPRMKGLYRMTSKVLMFDTYLYNMLLGLVVSVGDLTQSLADASGEALFAHLDSIHRNEEQMEKFIDAFIKIFENHLKVTRVSMPLLKTLQLILQRGYFSGIADVMQDPKKKDSPLSQTPTKIFSLVKQEIARTKDAQRLLTSIEVFCGFLQLPSDDLRKCTISQLLRMLCHVYPKVRRSTATQLYESVLTYDDLVSDMDNLETVMTILSETVWDSPVDALRPIRNELCPYFSVAVPKLVSKK
ncbi:tubulin-specific chaperone D-like [Styela clava]